MSKTNKNKIEETLSMGLPEKVAKEVAASLAHSGVYYEQLFAN
jgi:hypothetical protein